MKQKIILISTLLLTFLLFGCSNDNLDVVYKEDTEHEYSSNYTYKFVGESEHFYFETGKVYYGENERELLISNFNLKHSMDKNTKYLVNLYFNDRLLYGNEYGTADLIEKEYKNIVIGESGTLGEKDENGDIIGESDSFLETTQDIFKDSIRLEVKYCKNDDCKIETLKIKYVEER